MNDKNNSNGVSSQGVEIPSLEAIKAYTREQCRKDVERDVTMALRVLQAVAADKNTLDNLADFLFGRLQNHVYREENKAQTKIEFEKKVPSDFIGDN